MAYLGPTQIRYMCLFQRKMFNSIHFYFKKLGTTKILGMFVGKYIILDMYLHDFFIAKFWLYSQN